VLDQCSVIYRNSSVNTLKSHLQLVKFLWFGSYAYLCTFHIIILIN
jgi:hypothetical protein